MLRVESLTHDYGPTRALDGVSFSVAAGEIVGVLGPNGAGKSTLFRLLSTYLEIQSGRIEVDGFDAARAPLEVKARLGYLPEHNPLFDGMRVDRFLAFVAAAHGLSRAETDVRARWVIERCELGSVLRKAIRECSKGFRQRIGLAAALIHDPPLLVLDEPTHGLDPLQVAAFRAFLAELRPGRAILFSSHIVSEVESQSDRVLVVSNGRLILEQHLADAPERARKATDPVRGTGLEELVLRALRDSKERSTVASSGGRS